MKNFIKLFIFSSLFLVILTILSEVFRPSWNTDTALAQLKDPTNEYDVLFIGDSDIFAAISPTLAPGHNLYNSSTVSAWYVIIYSDTF